MQRRYSLLSARLRLGFIPLYPKHGTTCGGTEIQTYNKTHYEDLGQFASSHVFDELKRIFEYTFFTTYLLTSMQRNKRIHFHIDDL
ncbi:unnamed protein product [Dicrocoelium dendriticum]|nr:unnamed protein product [Dicrocoelium dendriticum]